MKPKILIFDIETSPLIGAAWVMREADLLEIIEKSYILCISWQWMGEKKIHSMNAPYKKDRQVCKKLASLIKEADVLLYQNGDDFDLRVTRTRMLDHKLPPLDPTATVDTLKQFRKYFKFPSNSLDAVCQYLGIGGKLPNPGYRMWKGCMANNLKYQRIMARYNRHDVKITGAAAARIQPWIDKCVALVTAKDAVPCPHCGSKNVVRWGNTSSPNGLLKRMFCKGCGKYHKIDKRGKLHK